MIDLSTIKDFLRHPAGRAIAAACVVAFVITASALAYMALNHRGVFDDNPESVPGTASPESGAQNPFNPTGQFDFGFQAGSESVAPLTGCYWKGNDGYPYAIAYPPADTPETLDGKPLVGYAVVWKFAQDEIVVKRHADRYRLSQWPIAYYLADQSANRVLLEIEGIYEAEGERVTGRSLKQTCSPFLPR